MSYDISFITPVPGLTLSESYIASCDDTMPDLKFTPDQLVAWHTIVRRVTAEVGPTEHDARPRWVTVYVTDLPLASADYWGTGAQAQIPFRYDKSAEAAMAKLYKVAHIVEEVTGLTGYDRQTELDLSDANLPAAIAHYLKTMETVNFHLPPRRDESGII